jgi:peptidoglycan/xylan/chitin deacetylase (PgdA/CDA1 family)
MSESYREEHKKPLMSKLPFNYHYMPEFLRYLVISSRIKIRAYSGVEKKSFPFSMFNAGCEVIFGLFENGRTDEGSGASLVLTHDVESSSGLDRMEEIAGIEERYGFKSSWNIIPKRDVINLKKLADISDKGHEIGIHGIWHNNREAFLAEEEMRAQFRSIAPFIRDFSVKGYRSPAWYRTGTMFKVLAEFFLYDSSCLDLDLMSLSGNGGVGFMRPFIMDTGLVELPCTLPFEAPLYYGIRPEDLMGYWTPKINFIREIRGALLVNTHPEPKYLGNKKMMGIYGKLLETLAAGGWERKLPGELAREVRECAKISMNSSPR